MGPRERARRVEKGNRMWVIGAYFVTTTCSGSRSSIAFCTTSSSRSWQDGATTARLSPHPGGLIRVDWLGDRITALGLSESVGRRSESGLSMKAHKVRNTKRKKENRRTDGRRPQADVEGYTAEAFESIKHEVALQVAISNPGRSQHSSKFNFNDGLDSCPCLVLNADYQPLSYLPLSLWGWQDVIKAVFMEKVTVVATYGDRSIRSARMEFKLPSVIALKEFVNQHKTYPAFTRRNLFLRDSHRCQYCLKYFPPHDLSFDHVLPKTLGGKGSWNNVVTACSKCNNRKSDCHPNDLNSIGMSLNKNPTIPSFHQLQTKAKMYPPGKIHETWEDYLFFEREIEEG